MSKFKFYKFDELYKMSSGISTTASQADHGSPFLSFSTIFNNYFLPENLVDLMQTSIEEQKTYSIKKGDIFLTRTSETLDELAMSSVALKDYPKATYSGFAKRLRPIKEGITYDKFMGFYLRSSYFRKSINNNAIMTLRASFNEEIFSYLKLYLPDYEIQKKIGDLLFNFEEKISLNNQINHELEIVAKTLYNYWFLQFDFPNKNGKPYKSSGGKMIWSKELKKEIPECWNLKCLSEVVKVCNESINPINEPYKEYKHYSIPAFDEYGLYKIEKGADIKSNKFLVTHADILVSKLNPWFNRVIYASDDKDLICSTEFVVWRTEDIAIKNFMYMLAKDTSFISHCTQSATGTSNSHKRVNPSVMMKYKVPYNSEIITQFGNVLNPIVKKLNKNIIENQELTKLRDWLLPMLINGQIKVI